MPGYIVAQVAASFSAAVLLYIFYYPEILDLSKPDTWVTTPTRARPNWMEFYCESFATFLVSLSSLLLLQLTLP